MQHIEEAGVHSGDSACVIPPYHPEVRRHQDAIRDATHRLARALGVRGLMNVQFAIKDGKVYVLEVNPRASRTVPFVSKAIGIPLAKIATKVMVGHTLEELGFVDEVRVRDHFVKEAVLPFDKFPGEDPVLGPEMKSTGEVMGTAATFGNAFAKAQISAGVRLPAGGAAFLSVNDNDKETLLPIARKLSELDFSLMATSGTAQFLHDSGLECRQVLKVTEGRPHVVDHILSGDVQLIIITPLGSDSYHDEGEIRRIATRQGVPLITTLSGAAAGVEGIRSLQTVGLEVKSLQEYYEDAPGR
jgi:carbamoyl-phosphate synthase large subunit